MEHPEQIGKYSVVGVAGEGNMGTVYVGHDPFSDEPVAIKVCTVSGGSGVRIARKLFFNEAHAAGNLDHPNILSIRDAGEQDGLPYIVMEYVAGADTLHSHIAPDRLLPVPRAVEILYQCARALDYAHRRGVVHRDIKPSNIMLTVDGEVKIGDFGIAQHAFTDETQVMGMLGSPRYMSPEQISEQEVNHQSDIFSLGVVAYELLTGRPPFLGRNMARLARSIVEDDPPPLADLRAEAPAALQQVLDRALAKRIADRYQHAREMAADLASVFGGLALAASVPGADERFALARELGFFNEFSDDELREVLAAATWHAEPAGTVIVTEHEPGDAFFVLAGGEASVQVGGQTVAALAKGECFGEMAVLARDSRAASVVAEEQCIMLRIDGRLIAQASSGCQLRFSQSFLRALIERLARTNDRLARCLAG